MSGRKWRVIDQLAGRDGDGCQTWWYWSFVWLGFGLLVIEKVMMCVGLLSKGKVACGGVSRMFEGVQERTCFTLVSNLSFSFVYRLPPHKTIDIDHPTATTRYFSPPGQ